MVQHQIFNVLLQAHTYTHTKRKATRGLKITDIKTTTEKSGENSFNNAAGL